MGIRKRFTLRTLLASVAVAGLLLTCYSCLPNPISDEEIEQVRSGMTEDEVRALLGEPDSIRSGYWMYGGTGMVVFGDDGKVFFAERASF